jgi:hypothetical protein
LRAVQGLHLGLFVETEDHCSLRRVHGEAHLIDELPIEVRIGRDLRGVELPGFQTVVLPDARHGVVTDPHVLGH